MVGVLTDCQNISDSVFLTESEKDKGLAKFQTATVPSCGETFCIFAQSFFATLPTLAIRLLFYQAEDPFFPQQSVDTKAAEYSYSFWVI